MNALGLLLVWMALQVSLFCLAGIGLYAVARRRSPTAGAWAAATALVLAIGISAVALSPWPRWWSLDAAEQTPQVAILQEGGSQVLPHATPSVRLSPGMLSGPIERRATSDLPASDSTEASEVVPSWSAALARFGSNVSWTSAELANSTWRWPAWLAVAILAGCALASLRLAIAVWMAQRCPRIA